MLTIKSIIPIRGDVCQISRYMYAVCKSRLGQYYVVDLDSGDHYYCRCSEVSYVSPACLYNLFYVNGKRYSLERIQASADVYLLGLYVQRGTFDWGLLASVDISECSRYLYSKFMMVTHSDGIVYGVIGECLLTLRLDHTSLYK